MNAGRKREREVTVIYQKYELNGLNGYFQIQVLLPVCEMGTKTTQETLREK